jgi:N-acetylglucosaminyldiphosphoundecaprenol N-acetyl-beta-D-mannosaminyltransferase
MVQFANLTIAGCHAPDTLPEKPIVDKSIVEQINSSGASFVFVGLGCPKQEYWCSAYAPYVHAILIGVGAAFDFHAGTKKRCPIFIQKYGMEWLYRLVSEPRRLWKRYLVTNSLFLYYLAKDFLCKK